MILRRGVAAVALLAACGLTAGCFSASPAGAEGRLSVALPFPPRQALSQWSDDANLLTRLGVAETLVRLDERQQPQPLLAESWVKGMDRQWLIRLRPDVTFHDGLKLTAEAAVTALNAAAKASPVPRALKGVGFTARAVDALNLEITTDRPDPTFLQRLSSPNLVILSPAAYQDAPKPLGTGPFKIHLVSGSESIRLDAFTSYWGGKPALSGVDARFLPDGTARAAALRAGDVDVAVALPISSLPPSGVQDVPLPRTTSLHLNTSKAPFNDAGSRAVVRGAVDREALARGIYQGHADPARGLLRQTSPTVAPGTGNATGQKIVLAAYSDRAELPEVASVVAEALRGKGFQVEQVVRLYSQLEPDLLAGRFDAVLVSRSYLLDSGDPVAYFASDFGCKGGYNLSLLCDPALDATITNLSSAPDRAVAAADIESRVLATGAVVPLVHERGFVGYRDKVTGLSADPYERQLITQLTGRG